MEIFIELLGYAGMLFIITSFLFRSIRHIRLFNVIGGIFCATYGILTHTWATAVLNIVLFIVNVSYLIGYIVRRRKNDKTNITTKSF